MWTRVPSLVTPSSYTRGGWDSCGLDFICLLSRRLNNRGRACMWTRVPSIVTLSLTQQGRACMWTRVPSIVTLSLTQQGRACMWTRVPSFFLCRLHRSDYRKYLPGQFVRIRLKIEQNCRLFVDIFSSAIINNLL